MKVFYLTSLVYLLELVHTHEFGQTIKSDQIQTNFVSNPQGNVDDLFDSILSTIKGVKKIQSLINDVSPGVIWFDRGRFFQTHIRGLQSLERTGPARITFREKAAVFETNLGIHDVCVDGNYEFWPLSVHGKIVICTGSVKIRSVLTSDVTKTYLGSIQITEFSGFEVVSIDGLKPFNWAMKFVFQNFLRSNAEYHKLEIERELNRHLNELMKKIELKEIALQLLQTLNIKIK